MLAEKLEIWGEELRQEGEVRMLVHLIERKFGTLTPEVRQRIESGSPDDLIRWADRVLTARSLDEVVSE